jgi:hypothetical protein
MLNSICNIAKNSFGSMLHWSKLRRASPVSIVGAQNEVIIVKSLEVCVNLLSENIRNRRHVH